MRLTNEERIKAHATGIPKKWRGLYTKAMGGKSRAAAMEAACAECMGWHAVPCTSPQCPLYPYRRAHR